MNFPPHIEDLIIQYYDTLTDAEQRIVSNYAQEGHLDMNRFLRGGPLPKKPDLYTPVPGGNGKYRNTTLPAYKRLLGGAAKVMKDAIRKFQLTESVVVYRGTSVMEIGGGNQIQSLPHKRITTKTFLSTSIDESVARGFLRGAGRGASLLWEITIPRGMCALPIDPDLRGQDDPDNNEMEMIICVGAQLKVTNIKYETLGAKNRLLPRIIARCITDGTRS